MCSQESIPIVGRCASFVDELLRTASDMTPARFEHLAAEYADCTPYYSLLTLIRCCDEHPADVLAEYGSRSRSVRVTRSSASDGVAVVELGTPSGSDCVVTIQPAAGRRTWLLTTDAKPSSSEFHHGLEWLIDRLSTLLVGGWVPTRRLTSLLGNMEKRTECRILPSRVASRGRGRSTVEWLNASSLDSVADELRERGAYLQSLDFALAAERGRKVVKGSVGRLYRVSYNSGSYAVLKKYLVDPLALMLAEQAGTVDNAPSACQPGEEIRYEFDTAQLGDRKSHERFLRVLGELPRLSVSASHINPYMLLSVVDYEDGSTMDILSDEPSHVVFMPGRRCSPASMLRLSNHLYSEFASGKLERVSAGGGALDMGFGG